MRGSPPHLPHLPLLPASSQFVYDPTISAIVFALIPGVPCRHTAPAHTHRHTLFRLVPPSFRLDLLHEDVGGVSFGLIPSAASLDESTHTLPTLYSGSRAEGDEIQMDVDLAAPGRLSFQRNGKLQYVVEGLARGDYLVAACLYHTGVKITIL